MCGILFSKNKNSNNIFDALKLMNHRGPDNISYITLDDEYFLGHNRLSILDLEERSNQPFLASDNKTYVIFNGEIYNHKELKSQFNIKTKTESDTEILVELYLKIGKKCLDYFNGMFSFVIFNKETKDVFAARDRLGIKPLYFYNQNNNIIFSSEIATILKITGDLEFDPIAIRQYLKMRTFFRGHTMYEDIKMFPAGHFYDNGKIIKYWNIENSTNNNFDYDEFKHLIESAIDYRKIADVEMGSYLSGGLDSSIIASVAQKEHSWTIGFKDCNEFQYSRLVADKHKLNHHEILINECEFLDIAKFMVQKRMEPLSVPNEVLLYKMTKEASKFNKVILSGEGADELMYGYDRIFRWANDNEFNIDNFDKLYSYGSHKDTEIIDYILEPVSHIKTNILKIATFFQLHHLHGLLRRLDNSTMLCSVEARVPFVDHRLIEYMYYINFDTKMKNGIVKCLLKEIYKDILPNEVIERKKVGFPVPLKNIFKSKKNDMDFWLKFNLNNIPNFDVNKINFK